MIKVFAGVVVASVVSLGGAFAADMAPKRYTKAPIMVDPGYDWTGFYAGLNVGYSWGRSNSTVALFAPFAAFPDVSHNVDGVLGGIQVGYNWQVDRKWLLGVEADIQATGERGRSSDVLASLRIPLGDRALVATLSNERSTDLPWFATFRGRAGALVDPSLLLYATGGLAVGEVKFASQNTVTGQLFGPGVNSTTPLGAPIVAVGAALSERQTRVGWTAGAGLEKKFSKNWSAKLEYLYLDLGSATYFAGTADETRVSFHDHILRAGINYQFTSGPVVAKY